MYTIDDSHSSLLFLYSRISNASIHLLQIPSTIKTIKLKSFKERSLRGNVTLEKECKRIHLNIMPIMVKSRKAVICIKMGISLSCLIA